MHSKLAQQRNSHFAAGAAFAVLAAFLFAVDNMLKFVWYLL